MFARFSPSRKASDRFAIAALALALSRLALRRRALPLWSALTLASLCSLAHGDAASGTYTGSVGARGNYYWEKSTRVVSPSGVVSMATPIGVRVDGSYLLDAITSASAASGVQSDIAFTEKRNEGQAGLGYEVDLGKQQLDVSARGRFSREPDYLSRGVGFSSALSLDQRNTILHVNGYFVHDDVYRRDRMATAARPNRLVASEAVPVGDLRALSLGFAWDQVINPTSTFTLGYDLARLDGFQANAYRIVAFADGGGGREHHPDSRTRHAGYIWFAHFVPQARLTLRAGYRLYYDSWEILAHAPDVRLHQELGPYVEVRLRYRYYTQHSSFFYRPRGNLRADEYITADPKMSAFHDQTFGLKLRLALDFLSFTALDALHTAALDWGIEYVLNTNRYGNGIIAQGGMSWSF